MLNIDNIICKNDENFNAFISFCMKNVRFFSFFIANTNIQHTLMRE
ncbi:hypothetical protein [Moraxella lacunata]